MNDGGSSSGRTTDSDSVYLGSNPSPPAKRKRPASWRAFRVSGGRGESGCEGRGCMGALARFGGGGVEGGGGGAGGARRAAAAWGRAWCVGGGRRESGCEGRGRMGALARFWSRANTGNPRACHMA